MAEVNPKRHSEVISQFADASNRMHAMQDIPSILRVATSTACNLIRAEVGAAGLLIDNQLAFSEHYSAQGWQGMPLRLGSELSWFSDILTNQQSLILDRHEDLSAFKHSAGLSVHQAICIPVIGKESELLACLILFNKHGGDFDEEDIGVLECLATMMSVAIENGIQLSESKRVEQDLHKSVATYRTLVEQIPAITYIATLDRSRILFVSPQVKDVLGYSQDDFLANQETWSQQIHPEDRQRVLSEVKQSIEEKTPFHSEYRICTKEGQHIWVKDAAATVHDNDQDLYLQGVVHDISERKEYEEKMMLMAHFDQLTGLANRTLFHDRLDHTIAQARRHNMRFAVLYMDLDGFKAVNDSLGHQNGDLLLVEAANRLKSHVREVDTVARMGGDEFTIILNETDSHESVKTVSDKLIEAISTPYEQICPDHPVSMSIGVAMYPDDGQGRDALITAADNAMYRAKDRGKNCCCFHLSSE